MINVDCGPPFPLSVIYERISLFVVWVFDSCVCPSRFFFSSRRKRTRIIRGWSATTDAPFSQQQQLRHWRCISEQCVQEDKLSESKMILLFQTEARMLLSTSCPPFFLNTVQELCASHLLKDDEPHRNDVAFPCI